MPFWKVRPGVAFAHNGQAQKAGAVLELPRRIACEFAHALDESDESGQLVDTTPSWKASLEGLPAHENVDILRLERASLAAQLQQHRLAAEEMVDAARAAAGVLALTEESLRALDRRITDEIAAAKMLHEKRLKEEAKAAKKDPPAATGKTA